MLPRTPALPAEVNFNLAAFQVTSHVTAITKESEVIRKQQTSLID